MKNLLMSVLLFSLTFTMAFAKRGEVEASVDLFPAGDFVAKAALSGTAKKTGSGYEIPKVSLRVKRLKTGIDLRDEHMQKYIKASEHSTASVTNAKASGGNGTGVLEFMGKKKNQKFTYKIDGDMLVANFKISIKQWGVESVSYKGVGVEDVVDVKAYIPISN